MKKFTILLVSLMLVAFGSVAFADDLNLTFDDDTDVTNWSHYDEGNVYTAEAWSATGGVDGGGALHLTDGGYTFLAKRPVSTATGMEYSLSIDINVDTWGTGDLALSVQGLSTVEPSVIVSGYSGYQTFTLNGTADLAESGYIRIHSLGSTTAPVVYVDNVMFDDGVAAPDLFFSEAIEGSSYNKAFEIYNPTDQVIDLSGYAFPNVSNDPTTPGEYEYWNTFDEGATIEPGGVYVIVHPSADAELTDRADMLFTYFGNGDDGFCLVKGTEESFVIIDAVGDWNGRPSTGWDVAGVTAATANHTLVRKEAITTGNADWMTSAGTTTEDSEWIVYPEDTFDYLGVHPGIYVAPVKVTFRANVSRIYGLVDTTGTVDIRGSLQGWTPNANPMMSDGGDYWSIEWEFDAAEVGNTVQYKYGGNIVNLDGTETNAWENDLPGALYLDNRTFVIPATDTVLAIDYVGHSEGAPFTDDPDSIDVWFRINMSSNLNFDPETQQVHIAGTMEGWSHSFILSREGDSDFWSGPYKVGAVGDSPVAMEWKYTLGGWDGTEESNNRSLTVHQDTTIQFVYYNDVMPVEAAGEDTVDVMFTADLNRAITENGFSVGDTVIVEWGYNGTGILEVDTLIQQLAPANYYAKQVSAERVELGTTLEYKYKAIKRGESFDEIYYDFETGQNNRILELPATVGESEVLAAMDNVVSNTDPHRQLRFRNTDLVAQDVLVSFEVDMRPAYYQLFLNPGTEIHDGQSTVHVTDPDSVQAWGVAMNGPATEYGWGNPVGDDWGPHIMDLDYKRMWDDGASGGDMTADDTVWTRQRQFFSDPDSNDVIGQEFKFGLGGGDNEPGLEGYGLNHVENIDDTNPTMTIHSQFGSINPDFYFSWDFDLGEVATSIDNEPGVIRSSRLVGNYPNPFNPVTTIRFELEKVQDVDLVIYDVTGREVTRLLNGPQRQGTHKVLWNGMDSRGNAVSTGVYFYRLNTGNYSKTMKMILMK